MLTNTGRSKCAQIYIIHADCDGSSEETNFHAAIVSILPDKKRYDRIFRLTLDLVPELNPQQMNLDFEASAIITYPRGCSQAEINGLYFHFKIVSEYPTAWLD